MTSNAHSPYWEQIRKLIAAADSASLVVLLRGLSADETVRSLFRLSSNDQSKLLELLPPEEAADILYEIPDSHAIDMLDAMPPEGVASIFSELDSDHQADLLREMDAEDAEEVLQKMDDEDARGARQLISYADDCAGGLMMIEYLSYTSSEPVRSVINDLASRGDDLPLTNLQELFVVRRSGKLVGSVSLADIAFQEPVVRLKTLAKPVRSVKVNAPLSELTSFFEDDDPSLAPVVDEQGILVGVLRRRAVYDAIATKAEKDAMKRQGIVGGDEVRTMPVFLRSRRRLSWLSINIGLNILAASVIAVYQDTLQAVIALAVFLPIVSDMSGCSGNQAAAVTMRELTLGILRPADLIRVLVKEAAVGLINGLALGTLLAGVAWLWQGSPWIGLVVGAALAINTIVSVSIGGTVPLILRHFKIDPALATGPALTTITDMCGFFLVLSFATMALPKLI